MCRNRTEKVCAFCACLSGMSVVGVAQDESISLLSLLLLLFFVCLFVFIWRVLVRLAPEGRRGMSDVSPLCGISGLLFDSTLLSPLLFFCLVLLPFLSYRFLPAGPFFSTFSRKFFSIFR